MSTQQPGCAVNCNALAYLPAGERTCELSNDIDLDERSYIDGVSSIQLCKCFTLETESNVFIFPIQVGLFLFLLSGIIFLGMGIYNYLHLARFVS